LSLALSPRICREVANFKPDIIHASSPGIMGRSPAFIFEPCHVPVAWHEYHSCKYSIRFLPRVDWK
jgi:sulfoquinovosyltransferase